MKHLNKEQIFRLSITLIILLSGVAMIPFIDLPAGAIGWESLADVYTPDLTVNEDSGAPGSHFAFTGAGYPPNSQATIYFSGEAIGQIMTDEQGGATFILDTSEVEPGSYNVTVEVDSNATATANIQLIDGGEMVTPPAGFEGQTFYANPHIFLPIIVR